MLNQLINNMDLDFYRLPVKAHNKKLFIKNILSNADDKFFMISKIDYNTGMIRFEHLLLKNVFINFYTTSFTLTIECKGLGLNKQTHRKNQTVKQINKIFNNPRGYLN